METVDRSTVATDLGVPCTPSPQELILAQVLESFERSLVVGVGDLLFRSVVPMFYVFRGLLGVL